MTLQRAPLVLGIALGVALGFASSSSDDLAPLQTRVAELETAAARATATPSPTATPAPDRIVGIDWQCTVTIVAAGEKTTLDFRSEEDCTSWQDASSTPRAGGAVFLSTNVKVLTIRTAQGPVYTIVVDSSQPAIVGGTWPP